MKNNKAVYVSVIIVVVLILGTIIFTGNNNNVQEDNNNINIVNGKQIITIKAKGGYSPRSTIAKAGIPTVIKVITQSTFDCSSAISIPSLNYRTFLPQTGETLIDVPEQKIGTKLQGVCAMGMYNFSIDFN